MNEDYIYHYGIKGMKWGIRRFQDKNGRLTSAGKKRYNNELISKYNNALRSNNKSEATKLSEKVRSNKDFIESSKKLDQLSAKTNRAYYDYMHTIKRVGTSNTLNRDVLEASARHLSLASRLRSKGYSEARKLLGLHGNDPISDGPAINYKTQQWMRSQTTRNVLARTLTEMSLERTATSAESKEYIDLLKKSSRR